MNGAERLSTAERANGAEKPSRLWLWFVAAFMIQAAAWVAWFVIASQNKVQEVPLETGRAGFSPLSSSGNALVAGNTNKPERAEARPTS